MNRCKFLVKSEAYCGVKTEGGSKHCKFHSSLQERIYQGKKIPRWATMIYPGQDDSKFCFENFPKGNYRREFYQKGKSEIIESDDSEIDHYQSYECFRDVIDSNKLKMPDVGCRYKITEGKYRGMYCCQPNQPQSDYCTFHTSVYELPNFLKEPVPIWTRCILPTVDHSKLTVESFPWNDYDLNDLLFCNLKPIVKEKSTSILFDDDDDFPYYSRSPKKSVNIEELDFGSNSPEKSVNMDELDFRSISPRRSESTDSIDVVPFDDVRELYREPLNNFIVHQIRPGSVVVIGVADLEHNILRSLTDAETIKAQELGLILPERDMSNKFRNVKAASKFHTK